MSKVMVCAVYVWNLTAEAPALAAASTISFARSKEPKWFAETSAIYIVLFSVMRYLH